MEQRDVAGPQALAAQRRQKSQVPQEARLNAATPLLDVERLAMPRPEPKAQAVPPVL
jgi:hypothetical protein